MIQLFISEKSIDCKCAPRTEEKIRAKLHIYDSLAGRNWIERWRRGIKVRYQFTDACGYLEEFGIFKGKWIRMYIYAPPLLWSLKKTFKPVALPAIPALFLRSESFIPMSFLNCFHVLSHYCVHIVSRFYRAVSPYTARERI